MTSYHLICITVTPIPLILVRPERILLNELIHCCMPYFLVIFFLLGAAFEYSWEIKWKRFFMVKSGE